MTAPLLTVEEVSRTFGALSALDRVSFAVEPRERKRLLPELNHRLARIRRKAGK